MRIKRNKSESPSVPSRAMRLPEVCALLGLAPATIWRKVRNEPDFPRPFAIGPQARAWDEAELKAWLAAQMSKRAVA